MVVFSFVLGDVVLVFTSKATREAMDISKALRGVVESNDSNGAIRVKFVDGKVRRVPEMFVIHADDEDDQADEFDEDSGTEFSGDL